MQNKEFNVLFVCSGNSCRSPMAEGLLRAKLSDEFGEAVTVQSAGTLGIDGNPATAFAVMVTEELGGNIRDHRSQGVTAELVHQADIIFGMARDHDAHLKQRFPEVRDNVFLLKSFDRASDKKLNASIDDPIGAGIEIYRECGELIDSELERILPRLRQLIAGKLNTDG